MGCSWEPSPALMTRAVDGAGEQVRRAGGAVADDDDVDAHGFDVAGGVAEGFALGDAAGGDGEVDDVGGEALGGEGEGGFGAGGVFKEEVDA